MFAKKFSLALVVAATLGSTGLSMAGEKWSSPVTIIMVGNTATGGYGTTGDTRATSDSKARFGCEVNAGKTVTPYATCILINATAQAAGCWTSNATLIAQIRSMSDHSVDVQWNENGECMQMWVNNSSAFRPKDN
jgi:hypothetical protein